MIRIGKQELIQIIEKRLKQHKEAADPDGFAICHIEEQKQTRVAPRNKWIGTEKGYQEAIKEQSEMDEMISCDFCSLCDELLLKLRKQ